MDRLNAQITAQLYDAEIHEVTLLDDKGKEDTFKVFIMPEKCSLGGKWGFYFTVSLKRARAIVRLAQRYCYTECSYNGLFIRTKNTDVYDYFDRLID